MESDSDDEIEFAQGDLGAVMERYDHVQKWVLDFEEKYGFKCPVGVRGRNSDNDLVREKLGWDYSQSLREGMEKTYEWIKAQVDSTL